MKVVPADVSEHCAGLAIDILCNSVPGGNAEAYRKTTEAKWLAENAWKYGFILRYPDGKQQYTGVIFEPWHYRYVGVELATAIYESGLCMEEFYAQFDI